MQGTNPVTLDELKLILEGMREENKANYSAIRANTKSEIDRIDFKLDEVINHKKWQNGKLEKHDKALEEFEACKIKVAEIDTIKKETTFWRWAQRNKKFSIPAALLLLVGLIAGIIWIGPSKIIEETTGVSLPNTEKVVENND
jgi:hypothetical protein